MVKKPYIKKYGEISNFKVWIVDGNYIRNNINIEFTNCGQNLDFDFIPKDELWLDKEANSGEEKYFIDSMIIIHRLYREGINMKKAIRITNKIEKRERSRSTLMQSMIKFKGNKKLLIEKIKIKQIEKYSNDNVKAWIVNGELVRDFFYLDFTEGGHGYVYNFIPKDEVWIDDDISSKELKFVLLHELHERNLMSKGWCYDIDTEKNLKMGYIKKGAHPDSSRIELYCRLNPGETDKMIMEELRKA
jgi:hypothetical protein